MIFDDQQVLVFSYFKEDRQRENTDSPTNETSIPRSRAEMSSIYLSVLLC